MKRLIAFAGLVLLVGCQAPPAEMTEAEIAQIEAEVLEWADVWMAAWNAGPPPDRCEAALPLVHPQHVVRLSGGQPQTKADWLDYCVNFQENWPSHAAEWIDTDVRVISADAAILLGRYRADWVRADETVFDYPAAAQRILVERTADGWGFTFLQNSNGPNAAG
jgi:hypothetical protein